MRVGFPKLAHQLCYELVERCLGRRHSGVSACAPVVGVGLRVERLHLGGRQWLGEVDEVACQGGVGTTILQRERSRGLGFAIGEQVRGFDTGLSYAVWG